MDDRMDVSKDRLERLLRRGPAESEDLDFKRIVVTSLERGGDDLIELAKDVAAFSDHGGWLIIGIGDDGRIHGIPASTKDNWDEATLRAKLERYLSPGFRICTKVHSLDVSENGAAPGAFVVLLQVLPHPDGACIMRTIGQKSGSKKETFREGDVFTRRGSASVRARQEDMSRILNKRAILIQNAEAAARTARNAVFESLGDRRVDEPADGQMWLRLGWATSQRPSDLTRRIFYHDSDTPFEDWFRIQLEGGELRHGGHYYHNQVWQRPDLIASSGLITDSGEPSAYVDVRVHIDGWISIGVCEETTEWDVGELFGWWVYGACAVAHRIMARLELTGTLFTCLRYPTLGKIPWSKEVLLSLTSPPPAMSRPDARETAHQETIQIIEGIRNQFQVGGPSVLGLVPGDGFDPSEVHARRAPGRGLRRLVRSEVGPVTTARAPGQHGGSSSAPENRG